MKDTIFVFRFKIQNSGGFMKKYLFIILLSVLLMVSCSESNTGNDTLPTMPAPTITPSSGVYDQAQTVSITCSDIDAKIYYTLDGTIPTESSLLYTAPFQLFSGKVVKAKSFKEGYMPSVLVSAMINIVINQLPQPLANIQGGNYTQSLNVQLSSAIPEVQIRYTLDGTIPNQGSALYSSPINISLTSKLKAKSFLNNYIPSDVMSEDYTINHPEMMIYIPAGSFTMGNNNFYDDEAPEHQVTLSSFYISNQCVTVDNWRTVMNSLPTGVAYYNHYYPITYVTWFDTIIYSNKRSIKEGLDPCYSINGITDPDLWPIITPDNNENIEIWNNLQCDFQKNGYRLPTEAEWEYAAAAGNSVRMFTYPGSDNVYEVAWFYGNSGNEAHPVTQKKPNEIGLYDMAGNVWQWCWDTFDYYSAENQNNPTGPENFDLKILRGGSFCNPDLCCRITAREWHGRGLSCNYVGFRIVRR